MKSLYTASITPFDNNNRLDEQALRKHLRWQLGQGIEGFVLLGTTGETPTLSEDEQIQVIQIGLEELKGKAHVLIGTGSNSTAKTIHATERAKAMGADGALIVAPYYNKPTQEGLFLHYKAIAETIDFPIYVYNIIGRCGINIQTPTLKRIASIRNIIGVKEASGNIMQMSEVIEQIAEDFPHFHVLCGDDALALPLIALGGHGLISVVSNLVPKTVKQMIDLAMDHNFAAARSLHHQLAPLIRAAFLETNPIPIKHMLQLINHPVGKCRLPLSDISYENSESIKNIINQLPTEWIK